MKSVVLGTAGHVDHGKTALVEALTGVNTDRWEEERRRGITIDLGFARLPLSTDDLEVSIIDVPGHEDFVKNMLAGAAGIDLLLLTVAADEGPMPQTREHLWIARLLGVERGVVAVTKCDLVDEEWRTLVRDSIAEELERAFGVRDWPIVMTSAVSGEGLDELRLALGEAAGSVPARPAEDLFRLPVDRAFTVKGVGTVVTGTVWSGRASAGAELWRLPERRPVRVRGIQVHAQDMATARAGQRAAFALAGVDRSDVRRGDTLSDHGGWSATHQLDAQLLLLTDSPWPLKNWQRVRLHLGTAETMARVVLYEAERLEPGARARVQMRPERPVVARGGDRFIIRFYSPVTTIGGGTIVDPSAPRRSRLDSEAAARFDQLATGAPPRRLSALLATQTDGALEDDLTVRLGLTPAALRDALSDLSRRGEVRRLEGRWYPQTALASVREEILATLADEHARDPAARGVSLESLRSGSRRSAPLVDAALRQLEDEGRVKVEDAVAALSGHRPVLSPERQGLADAAASRLQQAGFTPPPLKQLAAELRVAEGELIPVLKHMVREGRAVAVTADLYFDSGAIKRLRERVGEALRGGAATPSELRETLGVSRKYVIPLLEHLDATGVTRRTGRGRVLREAP